MLESATFTMMKKMHTEYESSTDSVYKGNATCRINVYVKNLHLWNYRVKYKTDTSSSMFFSFQQKWNIVLWLVLIKMEYNL